MLKLMCENAKRASAVLGNCNGEKRNLALEAMAKALIARQDEIIKANQADLEKAKENGISDAMIDRLTLNSQRIEAISKAVLKVIALPDPLSSCEEWERPNGLKIVKKRVPFGVIAIIYEARPNVTADAAALCVKSGNAVILRGGKEAINSNIAIANVLADAISSVGLPKECVQIVTDTSRETANALMKMKGGIDLLIPRGGKSLIRSVVDNATVPVIETGAGNCHVYVERTADFSMATDIFVNAKTSRPSVCNACESLLVDEAIAKELLPIIAEAVKPYQVEIRGCEKTCAILPEAVMASEEDYYTEYNDFIVSVKVVADIEEAIDHINEHGSRHSEAIITRDYAMANRFLEEIDAAAVYVNASTRFTDGNEFGYGAEIGISTQKLHARGPMGLTALTSTKHIIYGNGQIR